MEYNEILQKRSIFQQRIKTVSELANKSYWDAFSIEYTHHSTAIDRYP